MQPSIYWFLQSAVKKLAGKGNVPPLLLPWDGYIGCSSQQAPCTVFRCLRRAWRFCEFYVRWRLKPRLLSLLGTGSASWCWPNIGLWRPFAAGHSLAEGNVLCAVPNNEQRHVPTVNDGCINLLPPHPKMLEPAWFFFIQPSSLYSIVCTCFRFFH